MLTRQRPLRLIISALIAAVVMVAMPTAARSVPPNPNNCFPGVQWPNGADYIDIDTGIKYRCVCVTSSSGRSNCRWRAIEAQNGEVISLFNIGAEWGSSVQLNYAEVARTNNFRSFGEVAHFNNGALSNLPAGWLANATVVYRWNGSAWSNCRDSGFYYSSGAWATLNVTWNFLTPPCGDGFYATNNYGFAWDGGGWRGSPSGIFAGYLTWSGCLGCRSAVGSPPTEPPPTVTKVPPRPAGAIKTPTPPKQGDLAVRGRAA